MPNGNEHDFWLPRRKGDRRSGRPVSPPFLTSDGLVLINLRKGPRRRDEIDISSEPLFPAEKQH